MRNWALLIYSYWLDLIGATVRVAAKSSKAPAPDPNIGIAAQRQMDISLEQLAFSRQQYEDQKAEIARQQPMIDKIQQGQIDMNELSMRQAKEAEDHYDTTFKPLETRFAADAAKAGTQAEQDMAAGAAGVDVQRQIDLQRDASGRNMASMGVNPNSGRFQGMDRSSQIMGAAAKVGAMNGAAAMEKARGDQMRQNAISIGRGIAGHSLAATGVSGSNAAGAVNLGQTGFNMNAAAGGQFMGGLGSAGQMAGSAANTYLGLHGAQMSTWKANQESKNQMIGAIGGAAGMAMGGGFGSAMGGAMFSDRRLKTNIVQLGKTPGGHKLYSWDWKDGSGSGTGVMADEVPARMRYKLGSYYAVDYSQVT